MAEQSEQSGQRGGETTPHPDPTRLTTVALLREIAQEGTVREVRVSGVESTLNAKIAAVGDRVTAAERISTTQFESLRDRMNDWDKRRDLGVSTTGLEAQLGVVRQQSPMYRSGLNWAVVAWAATIAALLAAGATVLLVRAVG